MNPHDLPINAPQPDFITCKTCGKKCSISNDAGICATCLDNYLQKRTADMKALVEQYEQANPVPERKCRFCGHMFYPEDQIYSRDTCWQCFSYGDSMDWMYRQTEVKLGVVYFARRADGLIKIGQSKRIKTRLAELGNPTLIKAFNVPNCIIGEVFFHTMFSHKRQEGTETFALSTKQMDWIAAFPDELYTSDIVKMVTSYGNFYGDWLLDNIARISAKNIIHQLRLDQPFIRKVISPDTYPHELAKINILLDFNFWDNQDNTKVLITGNSLDEVR